MLKVIGLSALLLTRFLAGAFAQQPTDSKEIVLPLPPKEVWQNGAVNFGRCEFHPRNSASQESLRDGLTILCLLTTQTNGIVGLWLSDVNASGPFINKRRITLPYHLLQSLSDGKTIFFNNQPNAASIVAFDAQGKQIWEHLLKLQSSNRLTTPEINLAKIQNDFILAYYTPATPWATSASGSNDINITNIPITLEKLDAQGKVIYANSVSIPVSHTASNLKPSEVAIKVSALYAGEYALTLESKSQASANEQTHPVYQTYIFQKDGQPKGDFAISLSKAAAQGLKKFLVDNDGNFLLLSYSKPTTQANLIPNQLQLSLYDAKGQKTWDYAVPVEQPKNGSADCLTWDLLLTPQNNYMILCQQRFYVSNWVRDSNYDKVWAIVVDKKGKELQRSPILQGQMIENLYKITATDTTPVLIDTSFQSNQLMIVVNNYASSLGNSPTMLTFKDWETQQNNKTSLSDLLKLRLFVISWSEK